MAKSKHVYSILIDGDISGLEKSMKAAVKTVADGYDKMASAADKVKHLKDVVGYISQVDNALDVLYHKNPDAFIKAFSGLDDGLKNVMQNLFNIEQKGLTALDQLGAKINALDGTEGVKSMRKMAEDINSLYEVIGKAPPINMTDGLFEGKGGKDVVEKRMQALRSAYEQFALVWKDINNQIGKGLSFGESGVGGSVKGGGNSLLNELKTVKQMVKDVSNFEDIDLGFDATLEEADLLMKKFDELSKKRDEFMESGDMESEEYAANYAELVKTAAQMRALKDQLSAKWMDPKELTNFLDDNEFAIDDLFDEYLQDVDELMSQLSQKLQNVVSEVSSDGQAIGDAFQTMAQSVGGSVDELENKLIRVQNIANQLGKAFSSLSQQTDIEYKVLMNGQEIDVRAGGFKEVGLKTSAESWLANLDRDNILDAHSHQGGHSRIDVPDLKNAIERQYGGLAKLSAIIGGDDITTLDFSKLSQEDALKGLREVEEFLSHSTLRNVDAKKLNEIFQAINPDAVVAKTWNPTQFNDLAEFIFTIGNTAQSAIEPLERFKNVLKYVLGDGADLSKYENLFKNFSVDKAGSIFNKIMKSEDRRDDAGALLQVGDTSKHSLDAATAEIQQQKDSYAQLRLEAKKTYADIRREVDKYLSYVQSGGKGGGGMDFFTQYFNADEMQSIYTLLGDFDDGVITDVTNLTNQIAKMFGVEIPTQSDNASSKVKSLLNQLEDLPYFINNANTEFELGGLNNELDTIISKVEELRRAGLLTADELALLDDAIETAKDRLNNKRDAVQEDIDRPSVRKFDEIYSYAEKLKEKSIGGDFSHLDDDEIGRHIGTIDVYKSELEELARQSVIANAELEELNATLDEQRSKLEFSKHGYTDYDNYGGWSSGSYDYSYEDEYRDAREEAETLRTELADAERETAKLRAELSAVNAQLTEKISILEQIASAYKAVDDAKDAYENATTPRAEERADSAIDAAKDELDEFTQNYYGVVATMQDGSNLEIRLDDDEASESMQHLLQNVKQIQNLDLIPRSAQETIEAYEKLDRLLINIGRRVGDPDKAESALGSFSVADLDEYKNKLQQCINLINNSDTEFIYGSKEQYEQAVIMLGKLEEHSKRLALDEEFGNSDILAGISDSQWTDQIDSAAQDVSNAIRNGVITTIDEAIAKFKELGGVSDVVEQGLFEGATGQLGFFDNMTEDAQRAKVSVEDVNNEIKETKALDGQISLFDGVTTEASAISNAFGDESVTVASTSQYEISDLEALAAQVQSVEAAIRAKTAAFEEEGTIVNSVVQQEIAELTKLLESLQKITGQVNIINSGLTNMPTEVPVIEDVPAADDPKKKTHSKQYYVDTFTKYCAEVENSGYVTDELRAKLIDLDNTLQNISEPDDLEQWNKSLNNFKKEAKKVKDAYISIEEAKAKQIRGEVNSKNLFKGLDFDDTTSNLTQEQSEIIDLKNQLLAQLDEYKAKVKAGEKVELASINATRQALLDKIQLYKQQHDFDTASGKSGSKYGATVFKNITGKVNSLQQTALSDEFKNSTQIQTALQAMQSAYSDLAAKRKEFANIGNLTSAQEAEFDTLKAKVNDTTKALGDLIKESHKLKSQKANEEDYVLGDDFVDTDMGRKSALEDFVKTVYPASAAITEFRNNFTEAMFAVDNGDGTITKMTAQFDKARTEIVALAKSTQKVIGPFEAFTTGVWDKLKTLSTYFTASEILQRTWQAFKEGVQSVREIDSALTELKKVTDETDATYNAFLQDMSKTASVVGSTVKDLTSSAADWARLGYSLQDAGQLAATTAKLLNVSEFASVDDATSALVSTLQAFTTEGQDVGQRAEEIVDILNNIGNRYPVATNELAEGLASSGAALVAANNSIEEQVALLSAGNATMQDVSTVAAGLKIVAARLRGTTTDIDDDAESAVTNVSKLQGKIKALTKEANGGEGIDIINEDGEYKSTYEILTEISKIFDKMDDVSQASLLELIAGGVLARCV